MKIQQLKVAKHPDLRINLKNHIFTTAKKY